MTEPKETTIEEHIKRAKELTIPQVSVREEAFTELVKAVEKIRQLQKLPLEPGIAVFESLREDREDEEE